MLLYCRKITQECNRSLALYAVIILLRRRYSAGTWSSIILLSNRPFLVSQSSSHQPMDLQMGWVTVFHIQPISQLLLAHPLKAWARALHTPYFSRLPQWTVWLRVYHTQHTSLYPPNTQDSPSSHLELIITLFCFPAFWLFQFRNGGLQLYINIV